MCVSVNMDSFEPLAAAVVVVAVAVVAVAVVVVVAAGVTSECGSAMDPFRACTNLAV